ncbi:Type 2 DNA topoisomerase 6 subunit B-like [Galemys pyrenaicus]|uniref:Type 2 DNA topoisomerase 6 subunit B-like n=1 Tax=Galemys pyrenaicus TaxID=202257 RepID=A0A8J6AJS5_GALPY|nr:Type 2 DNA topoisomerase 6 subunit B-like [Galemys pyrenaicus]
MKGARWPQSALERLFCALAWSAATSRLASRGEEAGVVVNLVFPHGIKNFLFYHLADVEEKLGTLMTGSLAIKHFLHKISIVQPKIIFNFSVKTNGISSTEMFGVENEPTLSLWDGIALTVSSQHYVSILKLHLRIGCVMSCPLDFVLPDVSYQVECSDEDQSQNTDPQGQTLLLFLFVDFHSEFPVQHTELWGMYSRTGLPAWVFLTVKRKKKGRCHMMCLTQGACILPPVGVHTWLTTHLSAVLVESHSAVQDSLQATVDQAMEQHQQAAKTRQKLQASLSVAVNSIMSVVTGSTSSSFRKTCLQALQVNRKLEMLKRARVLCRLPVALGIAQDSENTMLAMNAKAADTQDFGTKLHKAFHEITQRRFLHHCSCEARLVSVK